MVGHVNMMDDVLISNLSKDLLRSSIRALISQSFDGQKIFIQHVQNKFKESPQPLPAPSELFPVHEGGKPLSLDVAERFLSETSCLFTCKLIPDALINLNHFVKALSSQRVRWDYTDHCARLLQRADGDIVQAVQAFKEATQFEPTEPLKQLLSDFQKSLADCKAYCDSSSLAFPLARGKQQVDDLLPNETASPQTAPTVSGKLHIEMNALCRATWDYYSLGPLFVPRLFNGLWQMSSTAWGVASIDAQHAALKRLVEAGLVAADMADHYGDAELVYGRFRTSLDRETAQKVIASTKWCVFSPLTTPISKEFVLDAVKKRSRRLGGGRVDLLQFHWYDYSEKSYLRILAELVGLTESHPHLVGAIGLCNFDAKHTKEACQYLLEKTGKVGIVSNQVQFSLIDCRPIFEMESICRQYGIKLLTYGTFCGGFLAEKYLDVKPPDIYSESLALTPSQRKYFDMISSWGSWSDFQSLLRLLKSIADSHDVEIPNVAARWILDRDSVGSILVGTRLGLSINVESNLKTFSFKLTDEDRRRIDQFVLGDKAKALFDAIGDCGHEYWRNH